MMAVLKGYFDDSLTSGRAWAICGFFGDNENWAQFDGLWDGVLSKHGVPYFHMNEMADANGVYSKWHPPQDHEIERKKFFQDLTTAIGKSGLSPLGSIVMLHDLQRFNEETSIGLTPYPLVAYTCMLLAGKNYEALPIEMTFDHVEQIASKLAKAREYADSDKFHSGACNKVVTIPLPENLTFREIPALQAADFCVWEFRKTHVSVMDGWHSLDAKSTEREERRKQQHRWSIEMFGTEFPPFRKSAMALLASVPSFKSIIWDYDQIRDANEARGGVWSLAGDE
jgi:hypothetical protein